MQALAFLIAGLAAQAAVPAVPGACAAPASEHRGEPGCYLTAELAIRSAPSQLYWHIYTFPGETEAAGEAARHELSVVTTTHGRTWLYVLGSRGARLRGGTRRAVVGPLRLRAGTPVLARFIESVFPPGMRTRVHAHPGPEAFYVVEGEQCMETPTSHRRVPAGGTYVVQGGPHVQAAPQGRRNIAVVFHAPDQAWMQLGQTWEAGDFCFR